jgi:hypothetical protein
MALVEERVRRRRRRTAAMTATGASTALVVTAALVASLGGSRGEAVDPVDPVTSISWETPASPLPGANRVEELSDPLTTSEMGTVTVDLGPRPDAATAVDTQLICLSAGRIQWPDGASMVCTPADIEGPEESRTSGYQLDLAPGQTTFTITAKPEVAWKLVTTYVRTEPTDWATNANGDTYGVAKDDGGEPDLIATYATNGRSGYAYADELDGYQPTSPADALRWQEEHGDESRAVTVYESDGETVIGEFVIQPASGGPGPPGP